ncbi:MAG TPA: DUF2510 domain-containing protein [Thermoleophilaceae bacterium]|jgi:hypothetical protein
MNQGNPPPNWYPDPRGEAELRYWDGSQWTEHTHSTPQAGGGETVAAQVPQSAPPPSTAPPPQTAPPAAASAAGPQGAYGAGPAGPVGSPAGTGGSGGGLGKKLPLIIGGVLAAVLLVVLAVVLLGGGEEKSDEDRVNEAAEEVLTTTEPSACTDLATEEFIQKLTGLSGSEGIDACKENDEAFAEGAEIENTDLTGDKATVEAKAEGGQVDGETIELQMVKDDGDWKVDDLVRKDIVEGSKAETEVSNTVVNFGSSEGSTACEYLSYKALTTQGGKEACETKNKSAPSLNYTVTDVSISGVTAKVTVTEPQSDKTIEITLAHEAGNWKIERLVQQ